MSVIFTTIKWQKAGTGWVYGRQLRDYNGEGRKNSLAQ